MLRPYLIFWGSQNGIHTRQARCGACFLSLGTYRKPCSPFGATPASNSNIGYWLISVEHFDHINTVSGRRDRVSVP